MIYEFKVVLKDVGTPVWRVIQLDSNTTFYNFHQVLQVVFDWDNYHLHSFYVKKSNGKRIENVEINPNDNDEFDDFMGWPRTGVHNEKEHVLSDWFKLVKDRMIYVYDFGDNWSHEITLTKITNPEKGGKYPRCINAKNMVPEEDSRGDVLMGGVDLQFMYSHDSIEEINEELRFQLPKLVSAMEET